MPSPSQPTAPLRACLHDYLRSATQTLPLKLFEVSDAHEDFVRCVCFDHHKLLSCADDGRVYLFSFDA